MSDLAQKDCAPCRGGVPPLDAKRCAELLKQVDGCAIEEGYHLTKTFKFPDFATALGVCPSNQSLIALPFSG
jgi:4a-hydroxytetrahydrobiopterin dehydratase